MVFCIFELLTKFKVKSFMNHQFYDQYCLSVYELRLLCDQHLNHTQFCMKADYG